MVDAISMKTIQRELQNLFKETLEGIRLEPVDDNIFILHATIEGPAGTPYDKGIFKVKIVFNQSYPVNPPKCYFVTKIFHPNVSSNGDICVNVLQREWKRELGIKHILITIRCLLIEPNAESALNEDAGKMLLEDYDAFFKHAKLMTKIHAMNDENRENKRKTDTKNELKKSLRRL